MTYDLKGLVLSNVKKKYCKGTTVVAGRFIKSLLLKFMLYDDYLD
jgi:hypothetical protein